MARLHRVSLYSSILASLYLLVLFQLLPVPLIDADIVQEILPIVRLPDELPRMNALIHLT